MRRLPRRPASRISRRPEHILFAPVIEMHGKEARAWSDAIVALIPEDGRAEMSFVGRYHDHLRRENGRWLLVKHIAVKTGDPLPDDERLPSALPWRDGRC
ncbi:nuclear transport factor 2 family protein [Mycobacterium xenopi]|uniref:nuclear transport factor 2 family protein n=2 Tax=Mycobacterium xenopi TaxID=1789 RepID=UPI002FDC4776